jgi:hypothetical protein
MYESGSGGILSFLPRAMEFHAVLLALLVLSPFWPWAIIPVILGVLYICGYCVACARKAKLDIFEPEGPRSTWRERFRWRAMIAWLHFLEPLARDWGRLKGGLMPWRTTTSIEGKPSGHVSNWWQRLLPFGRKGQVSYDGDMALEQFPFLERLSQKLIDLGCVVGWNPQTEDWDLRIRRGALGAAEIRAVIEHHGGPKRRARVSFDIKSPGWLYWTYAGIAGLAGVTWLLEARMALPVLGIALAILWLLPIREANRLEATIKFASDSAAAALDDDRALALGEAGG